MHTLDEPKHWKGPAPIEIQIMAHPKGSIQWSCPDCGSLHSKNRTFWRRAMIRCSNEECQHKFRMGVGFGKEGSLRCMFLGSWKGNVANRIEPTSSGPYQPVGRISGPLDWQCPSCNVIRTDTVGFTIPKVSCCNVTWFIQLLIYKPSGSRNITPFDWSINVPENTKCPPAPQIGQS